MKTGIKIQALNQRLRNNPYDATALANLNHLMSKELYVVYFESANYAGYGEHCLVWAEDEEGALENDELTRYSEDFYYEQDGSQYLEENEDDEGVVWASIQWAKPIKGSEFEEFVAKQPELYPILN